MPATGRQLAGLTVLDSLLAVASGGAWVAGTSRDLGAATPQADQIVIQIAITNAGSTDGYSLEVAIQWSENGTTWPDLGTGEGQIIATFSNTSAGADLTRSNPVSAGPPLLRHYRLIFKNNNGTDNVTVDSWRAEHLGFAAAS